MTPIVLKAGQPFIINGSCYTWTIVDSPLSTPILIYQYSIAPARFSVKKEKSKRKSAKKFHICDNCGKEFNGLVCQYVDENFKVQEGLVMCGRCFSK